MGRRADKVPDKVAREKSLGAVVAISEGELAEMFLHVPDSPGWKATLAVLDLEVQEGLDRCLEERLTNEQLRYRLGCVAGLLEFKEVLLGREREASRKADEPENL